MDKLAALPVPGDAFLLRRGDRNILVDGGYGSRALIAALSAPDVAVRHLHIVVCTHADRDHAGALTDLLDKSSIKADEFWLPGTWSDSLFNLLQRPEQVVNALVGELEEFVPDDARNLNQEDEDGFESRVHARVAEKRREIQRDNRGTEFPAKPEQPNSATGLAWLKEQAAGLELDEANDAASAKAFKRGRRLIRYRGSKRVLDQRWTAFWVNLIDTAERIRKIAVQAIRHNVRVRWFDFKSFAMTRQASGGEPDLLVPLNAVELAVPPPPINAMEYMLRLTPVNEECLVFFSPSKGWGNGLAVVFTGDSPLGDGLHYCQSWLNSSREIWPWVVATAPHHGSESNAMAYAHLNAVTYVVLWLRSGGSQRHPGSTYRGLPPEVRACTHCPHRRLGRDLAEVQLPRFWPLFRVRAHDCSC